MAKQFQIDLGSKALDVFTEKVGALPKAVIPNMAGYVRTELRATLGKVIQGKLSGNPLHRRSGNLARSGFADAASVQDGAIGKIGFDAVYARIQEIGTVGKGGEMPDIVPRNVTFLTIPLAAAMTPAGVARGGIRSFPNVVFRRIKPGQEFTDPSGFEVKPGMLVAFQQAVVGQQKARGIQVKQLEAKIARTGKAAVSFFSPLNQIPLFVLVRKASIMPKHYLLPTLKEDLPGIGQRVAQKARGDAAEGLR